jgi:hypothetical protein
LSTPDYPNFSNFGLPIFGFRGELYDTTGALVDTFIQFLGQDNFNLQEWITLSFKTPRFDIPAGPANDNIGSYFTSSVDCGWTYKLWLEAADYQNDTLNFDFSGCTASWIIATAGGADAFINCTASELQFSQSVFGSTGSALIEQSSVFTVGDTYAIVLGVENNADTSITVGDSDTQVLSVLDNETGNQIVYPFTPTSPTFSMNMFGNSVFNFGAEISYIYAVNVGATGSRISEIKEYEILCQCREYELIQLAFVNKLGGVDYWTFNLVSKYRSQIERDRIKQSLRYNYNVGNRQHRIINQRITENWTINTDYITDEQAVFIRELVESPEVYWIKDGNLLPIIITDDSYEFKSSLNDILVQYTISFTKAYDILSNV